MASLLRRMWPSLPIALLSAGVAAGCSMSSNSGGFGGGGLFGEGGNGTTSVGGASGCGGDIGIGAGGTTENPTNDYAALCGQGGCDVASPRDSCTNGMIPGTGGGGGAANAGGAGGIAGTGGGSNVGGANAGGAGGGADMSLSCKLVQLDDATHQSCVATGTLGKQEPCLTAADCGPGLGCVLLTGLVTGVCRAYCCGDVELCEATTYCAPQPVAELPDTDVRVPVCIDADQCVLLESTCPEGLVCTVVRQDGTTACIPPGTGKQGESCPCAEGFTCSKLYDTCSQLCHTDPVQSTGEECPPGYTCQGNSSLPDGFGVCIDI